MSSTFTKTNAWCLYAQVSPFCWGKMAQASLDTPKRKINPLSLSDDLDAIAKRAKKEDLSDRRVRELKALAMTTPHKVCAAKTTKRFALSEWAPEEHKGLFFLSMLVRTLYNKNEDLRVDRFHDYRLCMSVCSQDVRKM